MNAMTFEEKIAVLKTWEEEVYRIGYFLLENEFDAGLAAERALFSLFGEEAFWRAGPEVRADRVRRTAMSEALRRKGETYAETVRAQPTA
ncbi:hypothetical protein [Cohnella sp. REN36]|uniref:hypothetical protein n=1 Tax=Cohnella sp. REN36 TaxID=2887347 RepID=UPI001D153F3A|nr:hypothetical protein [Cohnella sp. REN36]MCC3373415.1 hypothetical protein [Cohnella sp. REN36]